MKVTKEKLLDMYRTMFMIRSFELKAAELSRPEGSPASSTFMWERRPSPRGYAPI